MRLRVLTPGPEAEQKHLTLLASRITCQKVLIGKNNMYPEKQVQQAEVYQKGLLITLQGTQSRQAAQGLTPCELWVPKNLFVSLKGENFFLSEILNFKVYDHHSGDFKGFIHSFTHNGEQDILLVTPGDRAGTIPILLMKPFVSRVDFQNQKVFVRLPEGWQEF